MAHYISQALADAPHLPAQRDGTGLKEAAYHGGFLKTASSFHYGFGLHRGNIQVQHQISHFNWKVYHTL